MFVHKPVWGFLIATLTVGILCVLPLEAQDPPPQANGNSGTIATKLQEMRKTSKQLVAVQTQLYASGAISITEVVTAQSQLLELELKLAKAAAVRTKVLSAQLQLAESAEELANAKFNAGQVTQADVLQSRLARMHIEVLILEAAK
jgi:outer membrane protein TolC